MKSQRKRLFLINRDFQLRLSRSAVAVGLLSTILTVAIVLYPLFAFEILRVPRFLPLPILVSMVIASVINIGIIFGMGILVSHRIAGPMYNLHRNMRKVASGIYRTEMHVRKDDELQFIVRNFNEMAEQICAHTEEDIKDLETVLAQLDALGNREGSVKAASEVLAAMKERMQYRLLGAS